MDTNNVTPKFCSNCGTEIASGENFCAGCGTKIAHTVFVDNKQFNQPNDQPNLTAHEKYSKMGGWLLVFTIGSIISILAIYGRIVMELLEISTVFDYGYNVAGIVIVIAQLVALCSAVFYALSVVKVFKRKPSFLRELQIGSILINVNYLLTAAAIGIIDTDLLAEPIGNAVGGIVSFFLMTLYYCKSVRVQIYMGTDEYMKKAVFAYKKPRVS